MNVAVLGASNKPERYSYKAFRLLVEKQHKVFLLHKRLKEIDGVKVYSSLKDLPDQIDTLTLYVSADISSGISEEILSARPRRIIFNPGAENAELKREAEDQGIICLDACTLVMLTTGQF